MLHLPLPRPLTEFFVVLFIFGYLQKLIKGETVDQIIAPSCTDQFYYKNNKVPIKVDSCRIGLPKPIRDQAYCQASITDQFPECICPKNYCSFRRNFRALYYVSCVENIFTVAHSPLKENFRIYKHFSYYMLSRGEEAFQKQACRRNLKYGSGNGFPKSDFDNKILCSLNLNNGTDTNDTNMDTNTCKCEKGHGKLQESLSSNGLYLKSIQYSDPTYNNICGRYSLMFQPGKADMTLIEMAKIDPNLQDKIIFKDQNGDQMRIPTCNEDPSCSIGKLDFCGNLTNPRFSQDEKDDENVNLSLTYAIDQELINDSNYITSNFTFPKDPNGDCYTDAPRDLEHLILSNPPFVSIPSSEQDKPQNSIIWCKTNCKNLGYQFAGLQNGSQCWCGNSYGNHGNSMVDKSLCNSNCNDRDNDQNSDVNAKNKCGAPYKNSIYFTGLMNFKEDYKFMADLNPSTNTPCFINKIILLPIKTNFGNSYFNLKAEVTLENDVSSPCIRKAGANFDENYVSSRLETGLEFDCYSEMVGSLRGKRAISISIWNEQPSQWKFLEVIAVCRRDGGDSGEDVTESFLTIPATTQLGPIPVKITTQPPIPPPETPMTPTPELEGSGSEAEPLEGLLSETNLDKLIASAIYESNDISISKSNNGLLIQATSPSPKTIKYRPIIFNDISINAFELVNINGQDIYAGWTHSNIILPTSELDPFSFPTDDSNKLLLASKACNGKNFIYSNSNDDQYLGMKGEIALADGNKGLHWNLENDVIWIEKSADELIFEFRKPSKGDRWAESQHHPSSFGIEYGRARPLVMFELDAEVWIKNVEYSD